MRFPFVPIAACAAALICTPATAAESLDGCAGLITSLPATLTTQGVWCLDRDLATSMASGNAITIATHNVTVDCNGFKLGGLGAGPTSETHGIYAYARVNATVRNCIVRGFNRGVLFEGTDGGGHVVEDSRFDGNLVAGIHVEGDGSIIRRNLVMDTGGLVAALSSAGIIGNRANILENTVDGVTAAGTAQYPFGIIGNGFGVLVADNSVRNVVAAAGYSTGITVSGPSATIRDNAVANPAGVSGGLAQTGIDGGGMTVEGFCVSNTVAGYSTALNFCHDTAGNQTRP